MGVAGGELLIPTIVLLYAVDLKLAGSLSLAVSLPTMLVAFARYSRDRSFIVLHQHRRFILAMAAGSVTSAASCSASSPPASSYRCSWRCSWAPPSRSGSTTTDPPRARSRGRVASPTSAGVSQAETSTKAPTSRPRRRLAHGADVP